jgi:hypothetical protein
MTGLGALAPGPALAADLRTRRLTVHRDGARVRSVRAVIRARDTPTPRGLAAVHERNRQPERDGFLGPWALANRAP